MMVFLIQYNEENEGRRRRSRKNWMRKKCEKKLRYTETDANISSINALTSEISYMYFIEYIEYLIPNRKYSLSF